MKILEVFNGNSKRIIDLKLKTKNDFEKGIHHFQEQKFSTALESFEKVIDLDPKDKAAILYIERCTYYLKNGVSIDWDGVENINLQ